MKGYSTSFDQESCAYARLEDVNCSYKDLTQVCGRIRNKKLEVAQDLLERASNMEIPILFKQFAKKLGHRRELGGQKGRYPHKAASIVLKLLKSAIANAKIRGFGDDLVVAHVSANKKATYGRMSPKGRRVRSNLVTSRIEIVLRSLSGVPKGVEVTAPASKAKEVKEAPKEKPVAKESNSASKETAKTPTTRKEKTVIR